MISRGSLRYMTGRSRENLVGRMGTTSTLSGVARMWTSSRSRIFSRSVTIARNSLTTRYFANAAAVAAQLLGGRAKHIYDSAITKPPHSHAETPWHQDAAFITETSYFESLVVWMPLQPADQTNGCMSFIPGSHRGPILTHRSPHGDNRINGLEAMDFDKSNAVTCPRPRRWRNLPSLQDLAWSGWKLFGLAPARADVWLRHSSCQPDHRRHLRLAHGQG